MASTDTDSEPLLVESDCDSAASWCVTTGGGQGCRRFATALILAGGFLVAVGSFGQHEAFEGLALESRRRQTATQAHDFANRKGKKVGRPRADSYALDHAALIDEPSTKPAIDSEQRKAALKRLVGDEFSPWHHWTKPAYAMQSIVDIPISGFQKCSAPYKGNVYYPVANDGRENINDIGRMPVVSYAHGYTNGGEALDKAEKERLFRPLVEQGFVVLAHQSGGQHNYCDSSHDQLRMLEWAKSSSIAWRIDFSKAAIAGHSMGGRATLKTASDQEAIDKYNIKVAIVYNPHCVFGCYKPLVPTFFITGSSDNVAPSHTVYGVCAKSLEVQRYYVKFTMSHGYDFWQGQHVLAPPALSMLRCYTYGDASSCAEMRHIPIGNYLIKEYRRFSPGL